MSWRAFAPLLVLALPACDSASPSCRDGTVLTGQGCKSLLGETAVRTTSVGFVPNAKKRATYLGPPDAAFKVQRKSDREVVFEGFGGPDITAMDTGEVLHFADFDEVAQVIAGGAASTLALNESTENEQFYEAAAKATVKVA